MRLVPGTGETISASGSEAMLADPRPAAVSYLKQLFSHVENKDSYDLAMGRV